MSINKKCNVGIKLNEDCNATTYFRLVRKVLFGSLSDGGKRLLCLSTKCSFNEEDVICYQHEKIYTSYYENLQCYCCDPWNKHHKQIRQYLRIIGIDTASRLNLKPGQELCKYCLERAHKISSSSDEDMNEYGMTEDLDTSFHDATFDRSELNSEAKAIGISQSKQFPQDLIQAKIAVSSRKEKIKLLSLVPESWSIKKVIKKFHVTEYMVKKARALKKEHGILVEPKPKSGRALSKDVDCVINFYCNHQYSRMCAGKKECLTVKVDGQKEKLQKRLLLLNIREVFLEFKKVNPDVQIGFSKFCELRPKCCERKFKW